MPKCSYCAENYQLPNGMAFVKVDGTVLHFCSSKCRKNMQMKRRKVRWILKKKHKKSVSEKKQDLVEAKSSAEKK